jgi:hypothetical protein
MKDELEQVLESALTSAVGVKLITEDHQAAKRLRRMLYVLRDKARRCGDSRFDQLSLLVRGAELRIAKREATKGRQVPSFQLADLAPDELPERIGARGRSRLGILQLAAILDELDRAKRIPSDL